ncbi:hypothetical protein [Flavobacterium piscis]|uniref:VCBS repeat-containing protein n=1 Tax=Flavobacterium piscis TaxID=1114874 RepID=A0ABU1YC14_9FLAO|nr:hypothetical protein [Flavobacterium piscis]MDR7211785.1 hypothetical protein [Flavobacterium piscis]
MKNYFNICFFLLLLGCSEKGDKTKFSSSTIKNNNEIVNTIDVSKKTSEKKSFHKLEKLFCIGDFDGDGKRDTIFEHNFSKLKKEEIEYALDPAKNEWEDIIKWFSKQDSDVYLAFSKINQDSLHLGTAQGLYCLLNIGDTNFDGKDEIAFVVDNLDFSNLNSCKIYSLCKGKWIGLKQFNIDESAFDFASTKATPFGIKNYLEKKGAKWFYRDKAQNKSKMQLLKLNKCQ